MAQIILDSANNLIQGDFDTATLSQRTRMQTSTVNATTGVYVVPNGSATSASVQVSNAADPTNASKVVVATNGSTDTQIVSGANGSGTYLPLSFYTNNDIRFQMGTAGELNVRTAPGTVSSGTSGQVLTSGGPGAGVSWATAASGQIQAQIFTSPGTFTTPASTTRIIVTVVGGGGGSGSSAAYAGTSGGTTSFSTLVSATGGAGGPSGPGPTTPIVPGTGTVTTGTALYNGPRDASNFDLRGIIRAGGNGTRVTGPIAPTAYSVSAGYAAGSGSNAPGNVFGGTGGVAIAICPVTASTSYPITVGTGGTSPANGSGIGGAVLVEFVG